MSFYRLSLVAKGYASFVKAIWRKLHAHSVAGHYAYVVHSHFACYVAQNRVLVVKLYLEIRIWQRLHDIAVYLNNIIFCQIYILCVKIKKGDYNKFFIKFY